MAKILLLALTAVAAISGVVAQRPAATSICDFYTQALFGNNAPVNQSALITAIVTRAVTGGAGNGVTVAGIVNLEEQKPFFNGSINYRYAGSPNGASAAPNFITNPTEFNSLAGKLVGFFGGALGCTGQGQEGFAAYGGSSDMTAIHRNMPITNAIFTQFNGQIAQTATSFGVAAADVAIVGGVLASFARGANSAAGLPVNAADATKIICNQADCPCNSAAYVGRQCRPAVAAAATRPATTSICDYYTSVLGGSPFSPQDESNLVTLIVTRAVLGGGGVTGIVNLEAQKPFFNGTINYRYAGGPNGAAAAPNFLLPNSADFGILAGRLVGFFGAALGCSAQGNSTDFPVYSGSSDMTAIHKNMPITNAIFTQFNGQIAATATSYGVSAADVAVVGGLLGSFNRGAVNDDGEQITPADSTKIICNQPDCPCKSAEYDPTNMCMAVDGGDGGAASTVQAFTFASVFAVVFALAARQ